MRLFYLINQSFILPTDKPSVPRDVAVSDITAESAVLSWQPPEDDGGKPVMSYIIEKKEASKQTWTEVATVKDTTPYTITGLKEGKTYAFQVCAKNDVGAGKFAESESFIAKHPFSKCFRIIHYLSVTVSV